MSQVKQARKHIEGAKRVIEEHIAKIEDPTPYGGEAFIPKWLKNIEKHLRNIQKYAGRLTGRARTDTVEYIEETANALQELANSHNVPWDFKH